MIKILVVDDSALVRKLLGQVLAAEPDFEVQFARNGIEALAQMAMFKPDVITLDIHMPEMDGLTCLDRIMLERPCAVVMVSSLTAAGADATLEALRLGAVDFVAKPVGAVSLHIEKMAAELVAKVRSASQAKLKASLRLKERVRHRIGMRAASVLKPETQERSATTSARASGDGLLLVGTSTGGPPALETLLTALPANFPWPVLVAQHMPATFTGPLSQRLNKLCAVTVTEVSRPTLLEPGHVYIGRGDADLILSQRSGGLMAMAAPSQPGYPWHPSTDRLVRSAMEHVPASQLIGVLMTGMGNDGAEAMTLLREQGGRTIAEAEETAVVWGMPGDLVRRNGADFIVPLSAISRCVLGLVPRCP